jgi:hypothetical protein
MSDDLNRLVSAARRHQNVPTAGQRAKMKRAALVAATLGAGSASALTLTKLVVVGVVAATVGSAVTAGVVRAVRPAPVAQAPHVLRAMPAPAPQPVAIAPAPREEQRAAEPEVASPKVAHGVREVPRAAAAPAPAARVEAPSQAPAEAVETPPVPSEGSAAPGPTMAAVPSSGGKREAVASGLSIELGLIRRATEAVDARDFDTAEKALNQYDAQVRAGALATEAGVLRVVVDCARGHAEPAGALARKWVAADPSNPALGRLRGSCAAAALAP